MGSSNYLSVPRWRMLCAVVAAALTTVTLAGCGAVTGQLALPEVVPGGVVGTLFVDKDHNGQHRRGEPGLEGWKVGVYGTGPLPLAETTTDAKGRFQFTEVKGLAGEEAVLKYAPHIEAPGAFDASTSQLHQHLEVRLGGSFAVPVDDYTLCWRLNDCDLDLPDLVPVLELGETARAEYPGTKEWYLDTLEKPGRVLLRFASMTSNMGEGMLHVVALKPPSEATTQPVQQRIYGDYTVFARDAGNFVYHPQHEHFHLDRFETYELRPVKSPKVVASGTKVSFCLTDIAKVPGRPERPPMSLSLDLPPLSCGTREQGISAGFTDYYGPKLPDQWVDVTDVPTGEYELVLTSDPDNVMVESDETNNTVRFPLHYKNPLR